MSELTANGIQIAYDCFGDRSADPVLLIMGLGAQMIFWDEGFCDGLAERGHFVIRFDNRDVGLSTKLDAAGVPGIPVLVQSQLTGEPVAAPYTLEDMALDAVGLLDGLGIRAAHVVGASLGGMIAQTVAVRHPQRVKTLVSIMSSTGNPDLPEARPEAMAVLMRPPASDAESAMQMAVEGARVIGSPGFPFDEERIRRRALRAYQRSFHPQGVARQMAAVAASGNRRALLASITAPTLVIHGDADPLVPIEAGRDTAEAVPSAELLVIEGMGHDLPPAAWPQIISAIAGHAAKAAP